MNNAAFNGYAFDATTPSFSWTPPQAPARDMRLAIEVRTFNVPYVPRRVDQQPHEVCDYDFVYADDLPYGDTLASATYIVDPPGLRVELAVDGLRVKAWIEGDKTDGPRKVTLIAHTVGGRVRETEFKVRIKDL